MSLIKRQAVNGAQTGSGLGQFRGKLSRLSRARRIDLDVAPSPGLKFKKNTNDHNPSQDVVYDEAQFWRWSSLN